MSESDTQERTRDEQSETDGGSAGDQLSRQGTADESADEAPDDADASADEDASEAETTDRAEVDTSDVDADESGIEAVLGVRRTVESTAGELIGRPLSSVIEIQPTEDGWRGVVEVVERSSIPDTQDILGRYEIDLTSEGAVEGYRRLDRYRRDDTSQREAM